MRTFGTLIILFFLFVGINSFGQLSPDLTNAKHRWTKIKSFNDKEILTELIKYKKLRIWDWTTRDTKCYILITKRYDNNKCINKKYKTITLGGCIALKRYEHEYEKRFPHLFIFRFKTVILGNIGMKELLYK